LPLKRLQVLHQIGLLLSCQVQRLPGVVQLDHRLQGRCGPVATVYQVVAEAEQLFTRGYVPALSQLVGVLAEQMKPAALEKLLREVGKRLAGGKGPASGDLRARPETAAAVLTDLGGMVDVEERNGSLHLQGFSCPWADAVRAYPGTCRAVESLVAQVVGRSVRERCDRGERPRCCFDLGTRKKAPT
jgi:DeoR family transcriptional regulator, suf operon transcriptional repressor